MKSTKYLLSFVLLAICFQSIDAKGRRSADAIELKLCAKYELAKTERDLRGIQNLWLKIKESAINSWNFIKTVAQKTKEKLNILVGNIKDHAVELQNTFKEKLMEIKDRLNNMIIDIYGTGDLIKKCAKKEQQNMEDILKEIMAHMSECIAEEINKLTKLSTESPLEMNQTKYMRQLEDQVELCERDLEHAQECLSKIREDIFDNFIDMESEILNYQVESRNVADDIKSTLVTCSINNLINATNMISTEVVDIAKCVLEAKEGELESSVPQLD